MPDPAHIQTDEELEAVIARVKREYEIAVKDTQKKLDEYMEQFKKKDQEHRQAVEDGTETTSQYASWRKGQMLTGKRWQAMCDTLAEDLTNADQIAAQIVNGQLPDIYALNHNYGTYQVEHGSMVNTSYTLYDRSTVTRLLRDQPDLLPEAKIDIPKDMRWNRQHITSAITQGVLQGEPIDDIAKRIRSVADMDYRASVRTARSAVTSAQNSGRIDSYRRAIDMGISLKKRWIATKDNRTRHTHRLLDGESVEIEDKFSNGLMYPGDPSGKGSEYYNCRCSLEADIQRVDSTGTASSSSTLPTMIALAGMSFATWMAMHEEEE